MNKSITQKLSVTEKETDGKIYKEFPCTPEYTVWLSWGKLDAAQLERFWFLSSVITVVQVGGHFL